ncbi:MAG: methylated-DNA--[protein]-cysteine S-methyltransferase [Chloroflexota bacterium]|nr:methylated-DNA--[protein]-cysteine S-methyltransferase [Chloroflexota bacterium]
MNYTVVSTKFGWVTVCGSDKGLRSIVLPQPTREAAVTGLRDIAVDAIEDAGAFADLPQRLQRYFEGERVVFDDRLDFDEATDFQKRVWDTTRGIPYGEVRSYSWVAERIGNPRAYRAVGGALARNPFSIIVPCHRVLTSGGSLGGFSGGVEMKKRLLELEAGIG